MIDTRGLSCPIPVVMVQDAIRKTGANTIEVLCDARVSVEHISRLARNSGYQVSVADDGPDFKMTLTR